MQNGKVDFKIEFRRRLYEFVIRLIKFVDELKKGFTAEIIGRQLVRSGTSVLANYVEAKSASSRKDFINFFTHSLKSANESKVWLELLRDTDKADPKEVEWLIGEVEAISKILASSIVTLKKRIN